MWIKVKNSAKNDVREESASQGIVKISLNYQEPKV